MIEFWYVPWLFSLFSATVYVCGMYLSYEARISRRARKIAKQFADEIEVELILEKAEERWSKSKGEFPSNL